MEDLPGLEALRAELKGEVLLPGDTPAFEGVCSDVWSVSPFREAPPARPALVVQPRGTADVAAAVAYARTQSLPLAVKCGGHGGGNPSWVAGGLLVDQGRFMRSVCVDPTARTATVDGGAQARDVDAETAPHGLAVPLGVCATVGVGGLALNGGLSLLSRAHGAVCDNILAATVVLADGSVAHVTKDSDPELFWALRGAGTALGVVTKLTLRVHDVSDAFCGSLVWADDAEHATYKAVLRWMRDAVLPNPSIGFNLTRALHPGMGPVLVAMVVVTGDGSHEDKAALLAPLRALSPLADSRTHEPAILGLKAQFPVHYEAWVGGHLAADKVSDALVDHWIELTADGLPPELGTTLAFFELMGGRMKDSDAPAGFTADVQWVVQAGWVDPGAHDIGKRFAAGLRQGLAPYCCPNSGYLNMLDVAEVTELPPERAAAMVRGARNLERLRAVKARVDPTDMFRHTPLSRVLAAGVQP
ncbi:FAD-linked oxidase [Micractinium conductrix]|uniref:FAD-linked oxidase n=1 Tax=Micractinium conductrix TaxID=554055 RepID=A0A2P6V549_9CHLO|nr:FAD-linked oxidase [Micractinium conductrix]|eukprot:PSC69212.1 FAD-linked oxidase [Micractinium conductrix]